MSPYEYAKQKGWKVQDVHRIAQLSNQMRSVLIVLKRSYSFQIAGLKANFYQLALEVLEIMKKFEQSDEDKRIIIGIVEKINAGKSNRSGKT